MSDDTDKRTDQRPNDEECNEKKEDRVAFNGHADADEAWRQERKKDVRPVQRRQRHEIKKSKDDVDRDDIIGYFDERQGKWSKTDKKAKDEGDEKVTSRTRGGDEKLAGTRILQIIWIPLDRLCPAKCKAEQRCDDRHDNGADGINVLQWIQRQSALDSRRRVAEGHSGIAMRQLVEHHGHDEDDYGKDEGNGVHICKNTIA